MDPFQKLPAELVLSILRLTADFFSINSLLQVSPQVHAVFQANSFQITKDLVASCPTTAHDLHHLFHITALIHSPSFNPVNFEELATATSTTYSGTGLNNDTAHLMISIAAQIQQLTCACLSVAWDNFQTAHCAILPEEWQRNCDPFFSWVEEFRVHRALWQLRIYSDIWNKVCAEKKPPLPDPRPSVYTSTGTRRKWTWSPAEADKIATLAIFNMSPVKSLEIHSVADLLRCLGATSLRDAETPTIGHGRHFTPPSLPLFASLHVPNTHIHHEYATWPSPPIPKETTLNYRWHRSPERASGPSAQAMQLQMSFRPGSYPTGLDDMRPFYRLGVFIWDAWRMYLMGFLNYSPRQGDGEMIQAPDGSYICPQFVQWHVMQKRWCALVGRKPGGSEWMQKLMERVELF